MRPSGVVLAFVFIVGVGLMVVAFYLLVTS